MIQNRNFRTQSQVLLSKFAEDAIELFCKASVLQYFLNMAIANAFQKLFKIVRNNFCLSKNHMCILRLLT